MILIKMVNSITDFENSIQLSRLFWIFLLGCSRKKFVGENQHGMETASLVSVAGPMAQTERKLHRRSVLKSTASRRMNLSKH